MSIESRTRQKGIVFDHWQIREYLGSGSGGKTAVFRLARIDSDRGSSALKVVNLIEEYGAFDRLSPRRKEEYEAVRDECTESAEQEVWMMDDLRGNTNIVDYLDHTFVDWSDETGFGRDMLIRMELLKDLRGELRRGKFFTEGEILKIGRDICVALILCHRKNILHRDVKPENIFLNKDGNYKLGDFGVSRVLDTCPGAVASTGVGTYEYWPREQMSGSYDTRVDTYSLGLVLYELSNQNRLPFAASTYTNSKEVSQRLSGTPLPPPCDASPALTEVILKACAPSPEDRFANAEDMLQALRRVSANKQKTGKTNAAAAGKKPPAGNEHSRKMDQAMTPSATKGKRGSFFRKSMIFLILFATMFVAGAATVIGLYGKEQKTLLPDPGTTEYQTAETEEPEALSAGTENRGDSQKDPAPALLFELPAEPSETLPKMTEPEPTAATEPTIPETAPEVTETIPAETEAAEPEGYSAASLQGIVNNRYPVLTIRSGPGLTERSVGQYSSGTRIEILETTQTNGIQWGRTDRGWVCMTYVHLVDLDESVRYTGWVIFTDELKVRNTPSLSGDINTTLSRGEIVYIYEIARAEGFLWGHTDAGWVSLSYIDMLPTTLDAVDVRIIAHSGTPIYSDFNMGIQTGSYDSLTMVYIYEYADGVEGTMARTERGWVREESFTH